MPTPHEILNEMHNNPAMNESPIVSAVCYSLGWIGSGILLFIGSIGEATDVVRFAGALGGLIMIYISARKGYMDNRIRREELKIKKLEALKLEKELNGSGKDDSK